MGFWLTTHWPPTKDRGGNEVPSGIWLQRDFLHAIKGMETGDLVLFYQFESGPSTTRTAPDGTASLQKRHAGYGGIVAVSRVLRVHPNGDSQNHDRYGDGIDRTWLRCAETEKVSWKGFLKGRDVALGLGFSANYTFRGLGDGSGLKKIDEPQFLDLLRRFEAGSKPTL